MTQFYAVKVPGGFLRSIDGAGNVEVCKVIRDAKWMSRENAHTMAMATLGCFSHSLRFKIYSTKVPLSISSPHRRNG